MTTNQISLRPYQRKFIDDIRAVFKKGNSRVCGVAPCGAGKTIMTGWMIKEAVQRGKRALFFVHRKELIEQTAETFCKLQIPFGVISAGFSQDYNLPVQIASVQTLSRRLDSIPAPDLLICDECHHILSNSYLKILERWKNSFLVGVTATPERIGGVRLGDVFQSLVFSPSVKQLIELGNLTPFNYLSPVADVNFNGLRTVYGEYDLHQLEEIMANDKVVAGVVQKYIEHANGKSCICYCVNVNHSKITAAAFNNAGIPAAHVDGDTPKNLRDKIVKSFRAGAIKVLCNAELFGEGFDVPNMDAVILARPTKSLTLHIQQSMRPMRPDKNNPEKIATIIDYVKNWELHGLPDTPHRWSLSPNKEKEEGLPPFRVCKRCRAVCPVHDKTCHKCGYIFPPPVHDITKNVGKLQGVKKFSIEFFLELAKKKGFQPYWAAMKALDYADSYDDVLHIADVMKFKQGWAWHKWNEISSLDS